MKAIGEAVRQGKVLVHCGAGVSRSPVIVAGWMHLVGYKNVDAALSEIAELRPTIYPSGALLSSVRAQLL
jgi:protein-tyrosine phosphatase